MEERRSNSAIEAYYQFLRDNSDSLEHLAFQTIKRGFQPDRFMCFAIDADDPAWKGTVEKLMPNADWQTTRERREKPVARGTVETNESFMRYLMSIAPQLKPILSCRPPVGYVPALALVNGTASIFFVKPFPHYRDC